MTAAGEWSIMLNCKEKSFTVKGKEAATVAKNLEISFLLDFYGEMLTEKQREEMLRLMFPNEERVKIVFFTGTAAELLKREGTKEMLTVYLPCRQELLHVSSTMVKNSLRFHTPIDEYVTDEVKKYIYALEGAPETRRE